MTARRMSYLLDVAMAFRALPMLTRIAPLYMLVIARATLQTKVAS